MMLKRGQRLKLTYILRLLVCLSIAPFGTTTKGQQATPPQERPPTQAEALPVAYCRLVNNPAQYAGKLVQIKATLLTWMDGTTLYDRACAHAGPEPILDCHEPETCAALRKTLEQKTDYNGEVARVEVVLLGRLVVPLKPRPRQARPKFMIKTIKQATHISPDVPWPDEQP